MPHPATRNIDTIIDGQLYIGNLSAAKSIDLRLKYGITHIVSVCQDYPLQGPNHMVIPVQDNEYDDILIHLPGACRFIQNAVEGRGRVLVHCLMGISRSATVVTAYLMATRRMSVQKALSTVKRARPKIQPNYGFIKELHAFEACHYAPSPTDQAYRAWKRRHRQDVTAFLNSLSDQTVILPEKLSLSSDFPTDPEQAACLATYLGLTHCLLLSPSATFPNNTGLNCNHIEIPQSNKMALLLALPSICRYIQDVLDNRGRILVHCLTETTAAIVVCAYLMWSRRASYQQAYRTLHEALPLFNATDHFTQILELYAACNCSPSSDHPALRARLGIDYQPNSITPPQAPSSFTPSSPKRAPGTIPYASLSKQWTKTGTQANHTLGALRPVTLDG